MTAIARTVQRLINVEHDDVILRTFILFVQTAHTVLKYADSYFYRKARLSTIKVIVLKVLATNGGSMKPSELAEWTYRERHNITTLIDRLKRDGLVRVERSVRDRRTVDITLTAKGRMILKQSTPVAREIVNRVMLSISERDAVLLEKSLQILRQNSHVGVEHAAKRAQPQSG